MKRPCFGYFFNKYCCSLVSYRPPPPPPPNAKPVSGKKAGKNKLVLSSVSDLQTSNTIYSVGAKAWNSKNERIFLKKQIFFIFCFSFLLFGLKFRATGILCFPNNRKCKSDRMLNFSLMRSAQRKASCCFMADRSRFLQFSESFYLRDVKNDLLWSCNGRPCRNLKGMFVFSRLIRRRC